MAAHPSNIQIERMQLPEAGMCPSLRDAFSRLEADHPQFGLDWLSNLAHHALDEGDEALVLVARGPNGSTAALPLRISAQKHAQSLVNFYTSLYRPLVPDTADHGAASEPLFTAILRYLRVEERAHSVMLHPLDGEAEHYATLRVALKNAGWGGVHGFGCFANWYLESPGLSWQSYLQGRPSRLRNTIGRKTRAFLRDQRGSLSIVTDGAQLSAALEHYTAIYNSSWKQNEPYPTFIPNLVSLAARRGWLRLGTAFYDGQAIASQLWLVANGTAYIFKLAYRPEAASLSPGTVLTAHMMQAALDDDDVTCVDYLSGDDAYKRDWMSSRRERQGLAAYNPATPRGLLQLLLEKAKTLLKPQRAEEAAASGTGR